MLRILHSLPRTHKLLLLPVATMVTVLGAQKLITTYHDLNQPQTPLESVLVPLPSDSAPGVPSLRQERAPVAEAIDRASRALDATREHIPLSELAATEIVDLDVITSAEASMASEAEPRDAQSQVALHEGALDDGALHMAIVLGTITSGMLNVDDSVEIADATSYEDYGVELYEDDVSFLELELAAEEPFVPEWETHIVEPGETFAVLAQNELGLGYSEVLALLDDLPDPRMLTHWRAGHSFDYQLDETGRLLALRMMKNTREGVLLERDSDQYAITAIERQGEPVQRLYAGSVTGSFARSAQATGLSSSSVTELTRILQKKLDFRRDSRRGDQFQVLVESDMIDGETLDSRVLAVKYDGERMDLTVVRNTTDDNFYTPEGSSLDPAFARHPFEGNYRLSSNFNPRRLHPVTGRVSPHNGTDFAMPIGTPITAPANGRVERVGNHHAAGRYIVVRHDNGYRTRYLHLSQPLVSQGERVTMGDRIALSGNTGRSTGPHLHYEVIVNNTPVNAMTVELPENTSLSGDTLIAFQRQAEPMLAALESGETGTISVANYERDNDSDESLQ
ncbi:MAG: peptidoglycan DD-metalloendopeptidase family protein [Halomonas sp.]|jgi:murein DD-endopeptidase|uniref:peptidoglycan DD-metalloendopeptidase family protein n=1 Tax=Halomonadaceae TaxID=28256 RepID=UPI0005CB8F86|nr:MULTISPECIES: peptidoglycan DD-metalloendopeptidase family protein [Halomonas]KJD19708.1 peptidase M23 [Halomonas meridiana]MCO7241480.1 peptidoglycan DD-metalloendopeptidase family protein [Halomonas sp. Ps84H-12]NQY77806.1 peptidoglycan DD-metalloendopeptidase family protein [Halomonas sp.]HAV46353.1 peptidase M23 [Halomonas sp.]HBM43205.1 peptidase M23 [Halomonas sp.]|tara:strand:- start:583 stop:2277 length:1695 start_codon:yes stop_codon:yes gene_type:complete